MKSAGKDILTYAETMSIYARLRGLKRRVDRFAVDAVRFDGRVGRGVDACPGQRLPGRCSMECAATVWYMRDSARRDFPQIQPLGYDSVRFAGFGTTFSQIPLNLSGKTVLHRLESSRKVSSSRAQQIRLQVRPESVYRARNGVGRQARLALSWMDCGSCAACLTGWLEVRACAGAGHRIDLVEGDVLDFYRVEALERDRRVRLKAELKAPGLGWMEWRIRIPS